MKKGGRGSKSVKKELKDEEEGDSENAEEEEDDESMLDDDLDDNGLGDQENFQAKKAWLNKSNCIPNFICPFCDAGFVRHDSYQSHLGQHKEQLEESSSAVVSGEGGGDQLLQPVVSSNLDVETVSTGRAYQKSRVTNFKLLLILTV